MTMISRGVCVLQMILQKEFHVIYALAQVCGQDRTLLASLLLKIFRHEKAEAPLLRTLNDREINMEGEKSQMDCYFGWFGFLQLRTLFMQVHNSVCLCIVTR